MQRLIWYKCTNIGDLDQFNRSSSRFSLEDLGEGPACAFPFIPGCGEREKTNQD